MHRNLMPVVVILTALIGGWYLLHGRHDSAEPAPPRSALTNPSKLPEGKGATSAAPTVSVVEASVVDFTETVLVTGSVVARSEVMISPEIEGFRITELAAEEGDWVTKGQLLARLTSDTLEAQLAQNEANIARSDAAISVARSAIVQADAALKEADAAFDRARPLKQSGTISGALFDQREAAARTAEARLASARESLKSAEADKVALAAARRELEWRRSKSEIRSPVDGHVSRRTARLGAVASAQAEPLFRLIEKGEIELDAEVAERDLGKIREGQPASITVTGAGDAAGKVRLISSEVDRTTRIGKVKIGIGTNRAFKIGAFGRGTIETGRSRGVGVPTSAVIFNQDSATVQAIQGDRVVTRTVETGIISGQYVEIRKGLSERELVVAKSGSFLRDGDVVRPIVAPTKVSGVTQ